jgi:hypothetical protein
MPDNTHYSFSAQAAETPTVEAAADPVRDLTRLLMGTNFQAGTPRSQSADHTEPSDVGSPAVPDLALDDSHGGSSEAEEGDRRASSRHASPAGSTCATPTTLDGNSADDMDLDTLSESGTDGSVEFEYPRAGDISPGSREAVRRGRTDSFTGNFVDDTSIADMLSALRTYSTGLRRLHRRHARPVDAAVASGASTHPSGAGQGSTPTATASTSGSTLSRIVTGHPRIRRRAAVSSGMTKRSIGPR